METENTNVTNTVESKKQSKKQTVKIEDSLIVKVKSNFYGKLIYKNKRSGEITIWEHAGDIQLMTIGDLRIMKASQAGFFQKQLIVIVGVDDETQNAPMVADIYKALVIDKYYENYVDPATFNMACKWEPDEIEERVGMLSKKGKENLTIALNTFIKNGTLDSIKRIRAFEKALGTELYVNE